MTLTLEEACLSLKANDKTFTSLELQNLGDTGAVNLAFALKKNETIQILSLPNNSIGAAGIARIAKALEENYSLERLYLQDNTIEDKGAEALAALLKKNISIRVLNVARNKIGSVGAAALCEALLENESLHRFYIYENEITGHGASAVAQVLEQNTNLQELFCWGNPFGSAGHQELSQALESALSDDRQIQFKSDWNNGGSNNSADKKVSPGAPRRKLRNGSFLKAILKEKATSHTQQHDPKPAVKQAISEENGNTVGNLTESPKFQSYMSAIAKDSPKSGDGKKISSNVGLPTISLVSQRTSAMEKNATNADKEHKSGEDPLKHRLSEVASKARDIQRKIEEGDEGTKPRPIRRLQYREASNGSLLTSASNLCSTHQRTGNSTSWSSSKISPTTVAGPTVTLPSKQKFQELSLMQILHNRIERVEKEANTDMAKPPACQNKAEADKEKTPACQSETEEDVSPKKKWASPNVAELQNLLANRANLNDNGVPTTTTKWNPTRTKVSTKSLESIMKTRQQLDESDSRRPKKWSPTRTKLSERSLADTMAERAKLSH